MDIISPLLRVDYREFCVSRLVLRQIRDIFGMANIKPGQISSSTIISGERRMLIEQYYATLNWNDEQDGDKFLKAIGYTIAQSYLSVSDKEYLKEICEREGFIVEGINIYRRAAPPSKQKIHIKQSDLLKLKIDFLEVDKLPPQQRGFAFEKFLNQLFEIYGFAPRNSFRIVGEQIDGSFEINSDVYLLEAKWQSKPTSQDDLLVFRGKVEAKSTWARGLFISVSGFSQDGLTAFSKGKATNIIGMSGQDLYFILNGDVTLTEVINKKARSAAETGDFFVTVFDLMRG
jgi:hypothetical protein